MLLPMHRDHTVTSEWHSDPVLYRQRFVLLFININLPFIVTLFYYPTDHSL